MSNSIVDSIKSFYFSLEDKYYSLMDKINEKIPVYKVIDPIDKVVPSFIVLICLALLLFLGGLMLIFSFFGSSNIANFVVVSDSVNPLEAVEVNLIFEDGSSETVTTDVFGEFSLAVNSAKVLVEISFDDYDDYSEEIEVDFENINEIVLSKKKAVVKEKVLEIKKRDGSALSGTSIRFSCSGNGAPPSTIRNAGSTERVMVSESCGILSAVVTLVGYDETRRTLSGPKTIIFMDTQTAVGLKGELKVTVVDADSGDEISGVEVNLFKGNSSKGKGQTDSLGRYTFEVEPGDYFVRAKDLSIPAGYSDSESAVVQVDVDDVKEITIELTEIELSDIMQIIVQFVDADTEDEIENAQVQFFKDNVLDETVLTDVEGKAVYYNASEDNEYSLVVTSEAYILRTVIDLPLISVSSIEAEVIELTKAEAPEDFSSILVTVKSYQGNEIEDAEVRLYVDDLDFILSTGITDSEGQIVFENLPFGSYKAEAEAQGQSGETEYAELSSAATLSLEVLLVLEEGDMQVEVVDKSDNPISGAKVEFFDAIKGKLKEELTDADGETEKVSFLMDNNPYLVVSHDGYIVAETVSYSLAASGTVKVKVVLRNEEDYSGLRCDSGHDFCIGLDDIVSKSSRSAISEINDNKHYTLLMDVYAKEELDSVKAVVRTGLESNRTANESIIIIKEIRSSEAAVVTFSDYDLSDNYAESDSTDADGKQVILSFNSLSAGMHHFEVDVYVKKLDAGVEEDDVQIEIRYGMKVVDDGDTSYLPTDSSELFLEGPFILGETMFCDSGDCPNFVFDVVLRNPSGTHFSGDVSLDSEVIQELMISQIYEIDVKIINNHYAEEEFEGEDLVLTTDTAIEVAPTSITLDYLNYHSSYNVPGITLTPKSSVYESELEIKFDVDKDDNNATYKFKVSAEKEIEISTSPSSIRENAPTTLQVTLEEKDTTNLVSGATVTWWNSYTDGIVTLPGGSFFESPLGGYLANIPAYEAGESIYIVVTKAFYATPDVYRVNVSTESINFSDLWQFNCVDVQDSSGASIDGESAIADVVHGSSKNIFKITNNCDSSVQIGLNVPFASLNQPTPFLGGPITLQDEEDTILENQCNTPSCSGLKTLGSGASLEVKALGNKLLGVYDVEIYIKDSNESNLHPFKTISVLIEPNGNENFVIDEAIFDFLTDETSATITNNSFVDLKDFWKPKVDFVSDDTKYSAVQERYDAIGLIEFDWELKAIGIDNDATYLTTKEPSSSISVSSLPNCAYCTYLCSGAGTCSEPKTFDLKPIEEIDKVILKDVWFSPGSEVRININDGAFVHTIASTCGDAETKKEYETVETEIPLTVFTNHFDLNTISATVTACTPEEQAFVGAEIVIYRGSTNLNEVIYSGSYQILHAEDKIYDIEPIPADSLEALDGIDPFLDELRYEVTNDSGGLIETWVENSTGGDLSVKARFAPVDIDGSEDIPFEVRNNGLIGSEFGLLKVTDYVSAENTPDFSEIDFIYFATVANVVNEEDSEESYENSVTKEVVVLANGVEQDLGKISEIISPEIEGDEFVYTLSEDDEFVNIYFRDSYNAPRFTTTNPDSHVFVSTGYNMIASKEVDVAILIDTSGSMNEEWSTMCNEKERIHDTLVENGFDVEMTVFAMEHERGSCTDDVVGETTFNIWNWIFGAEDAIDEAWGMTGIEVIENKFDWRDDARKILIVIGDNDPSGQGRWRGETEDGVDGELVIALDLIETANEEGVSVFFLHPANMEADSIDKLTSENDFDETKNDALELMELVANQTNGKVDLYGGDVDVGNVNRLVLMILRSTHPAVSGYFHVKLSAGEENVCYGSNGRVGTTGVNAVPRVLPSWDWDKIGLDTCNPYQFETGLENRFVYCDSTQFTTEILKRLIKYRTDSEAGTRIDAGKLLNFNAYLMADKLSDDFKADFGDYILSDFGDFSQLTDNEKVWNSIFPNNIEFTGLARQIIPSSGLYSVNIGLDWVDSDYTGIFFVGETESQPNVKVTVNLTLEQESVISNVLYSLPIDGAVGLNEAGILARDGYGVGFAGNNFGSLGLYDVGDSGTMQIPATVGSPFIGDISLTKDVDLLTLNNTSRGNLLSIIRNQSGGFNFVFTPSFPNPLLLNSKTNAEVTLEDVASYLVLTEPLGRHVADLPYVATWTAFASNIAPCGSINLTVNDNEVRLFDFVDAQDVKITASIDNCKFENDVTTAYGFSFNELMPDTYVSLKSIIYTPVDGYSVKNACSSADGIDQSDYFRLTALNDESLGTDLVNLDASVSEIESLSDLFDLVEQEYVCVSKPINDFSLMGEKTEFWWNEEKIFDAQAQVKSSYICSLDFCGNVPDACASS